MALPASGQQPIWPLDVTLTAKRVGDKAAGTVTIINPTKEPVEVRGCYMSRITMQHML
jgi:hypothetical protein